MKKCLLDLSLIEMEEIITGLGEKKFHAKQLFDGVFSGKQISEITNISKNLRAKLQELEVLHKTNMAAASKVRGDIQTGFMEDSYSWQK